MGSNLLWPVHCTEQTRTRSWFNESLTHQLRAHGSHPVRPGWFGEARPQNFILRNRPSDCIIRGCFFPSDPISLFPVKLVWIVRCWAAPYVTRWSVNSLGNLRYCACFSRQMTLVPYAATYEFLNLPGYNWSLRVVSHNFFECDIHSWNGLD